ncbi:hypothetical protein AHMF7605_15620 [Adhaeribacter arboris]|uniref:Secretion system C-terminal sorting domain-containing protein n=1 Tax=Adhaeribacter arboris TaxID=2072846 RepID=A0A2T2YH45_9BACT|nr:T9SS type A sorting domain-containing protein [Adhaeribacter arboris]PSR54829.1 hypothetical protein AHMF7605_15620 [Adhaeribacter arboris]
MKIHVSLGYPIQLNRVFNNWWIYLCPCFLLHFTFPTQTFAQNKVWDKTLGGEKLEILTVVKQTSDGGYILGGSSASGISGDKSEPNKGEKDEFGAYPNDYWVVKLNADGSKAWDKTIGGREEDVLNSIQLTSDGGYLLGGTSTSGVSGNKKDINYGASDYWLVKLDAKGNKLWDKSYGGKGSDNLVSLQPSSDGGYLLGGSSTSGINGNKTHPKIGRSDFWIVKLQADGTMIWDRTFGGTNDDFLSTFVSTPDGGCLLSGQIYEIGTKLIKVKADGSQDWEKTVGYPEIIALQTIKEGGFIAGYSVSTSSASFNYGIRKLKSDGTPVWEKSFGGNDSDYLKFLQVTTDGGYILGGTSYSDSSGVKTEHKRGTCLGENFFLSSCGTDYWVLKLNADGTQEWDRTIGSEEYDDLTFLQQTKEGGYILGGTASSGSSYDKTQTSRGSNDYWVVQLDNTVRQNQTITFAPIVLTKIVGDAPFALEAKASSGLPIAFRVLSGPATVKGNIVTLTGVGEVRVQAYQAGNATYNSAATDQTFVVDERKYITKQWDKTYGGFNQETLSALIPTPDGGYLAGGYSNSGNTGDKSSPGKGRNDYWLTKLNNQGQKEWDKAYGGNNGDSLMALVATPDGGFLLGGTSYSGKSGDKSQEIRGSGQGIYGHGDYWLVKIDAQGTKLWDKTYGGNAADELMALMTTPDGGFLLGGTSYSGKSGDKSQASKDTEQEAYLRGDYWLVKVDAKGTKLWDKTFGGGGSDKLMALVVAPEGGYLVGGSSTSGISGDKSEVNRSLEDYWVVRLKEDGSKIWDKTLGGLPETVYYDECNENCEMKVGRSILTALVATPDGSFLLGGYSNAEKGADKTDGNLVGSYSSSILNDYWIVKIDSKGKKMWDKTYGGIFSEKVLDYDIGTYFTGNSQLSSIIATPDGNYLLAGTSDSDKGRDRSENARGGGELYIYLFRGEIPDDYRIGRRSERDYWVVKIDEEGTKKWDRTIGSRDFDVLKAVVPTADGSYVLGGTSNGLIGGDKTEATRDTTQFAAGASTDFWLVKVKDETSTPSAVWNMRYGGTGTDNFTVAIPTSDGGYLAGGYTNSGSSKDKSQTNQGKNDYWIVKSDQNGKKLWDKRYGGSGDDYLNRVIPTQDGGYLLAGSSLSGKNGDKSDANLGERDYWVVKVDAAGNKQWDKTFGGTGYDELKKVIQLASGEYVLGGYSNSPVSGDKSQASQGDHDYWLVKISANGAKIWDKTYGGNQAETLSSFTPTSDGGFLLTGSSLSGASGNKSQPSQGSSDYWIVKTDKDGNLLWDKTYGGSDQDEVYSVAWNGKEYLISGTSSSGKSGDKTQSSQGGKDYWVIKLDEKGTKLWDRTFGGNQDDELRASTFTTEGHYVLAGKSYSEGSGDKSQPGQGLSDYWVVQIEEDGDKVADQRFGGSSQEELRTVFQTNDGGLLLGGRSDSGVSGDRTQPSQGGTDYWLVKIAPITTSIIAARITTPATEPVVSLEQLRAYPNPFSAQVTIRFALPETQTAQVKVYDSQGREIATLFRATAQAHQIYQIEWRAYNNVSGMYLLQLQTPTKRYQQKLLLAR